MCERERERDPYHKRPRRLQLCGAWPCSVCFLRWLWRECRGGVVVVDVEFELFGGMPALKEFECGFSGTHFCGGC